MPWRDCPSAKTNRIGRIRYAESRVVLALSRSWTASPLGQDGIRVVGACRGAGIEQVPSPHPAVGLLEHLARVRLGHDPLTGAEPPHIHDALDVVRHLAQPVMLVPLGLEVDVPLRVPQPGEVLLHVRRVGVLAQQEPHHEGRVHELAEPVLFERVVLGAEHVHRRHLTVERQPQAVIGQPDEAQLDLRALQVRFQPLDGRVVAARVVADALRRAGQVVGPLVAGLGGHEDPGGADGVRLAPHLAAADRGGGVDRPVTGGGDVAAAALLHVLEGAAGDLDGRLVRRPDRRRADRRAGEAPRLELVVKPRLAEVPVLLGHPLLEPHMRLNKEAHRPSPPPAPPSRALDPLPLPSPSARAGSKPWTAAPAADAERAPPWGAAASWCTAPDHAGPAARACWKSAHRSSGCSSPTETRMLPSPMPAALSPAASSCRWEVEAGCSTRVSTPPSDGAIAASRSAVMNRRPASRPPATSKATMPP